MGKISRWLPWLVVAVVGLIGWQFVALHLRHDGALAQEAKDLRHLNDSLATAGATKEVVYLHRTDTLRLVRRHTDSVLVVDTLVRADTVRALVQAERRACDAVVSTCEEQKAILRRQVANVQAQLAIEKKRRPGLFAQLGNKILLVGIGFGAAKILSR